MKTIRIIAISIVLALMSSANLWATDYLFGYGGKTRYYLGIPESPSSSGNCETVVPTASNLGTRQRCTWHCVSSKGGTTGSDISTSSSSHSYLYVEYNGTKYWLTNSGSTPKYTTESNNASEFYYASKLMNGSDNTIQLNSTSLNKGSYTYVCASKENTGGVYVTSNSSWDDTPSAKADLAHLADGNNKPTYTIYAKAADGYKFKGWSKNNNFTDCDPSVNPPTSEKHGPTTVTLPISTGYIAHYYAMFVPYWKFSASGGATSAGHGSVSVNLTKSEIIATDNSTTTGTTTAKFTATPESGYAFAGWTDTQDGTTVTQGTENPKTVTITNTTPGSTANVTLYAIFKTSYVVHFHPHDEMESGHSVTGTMDDKTFFCGEDGTLPANTFVNTITTKFDGDGGQLKDPSSGDFVDSYTLTQSAIFHFWKDKASPKDTLWDKGTINKSGLTELDLYANWSNPGVKYPEGKRGDRTLTKFDNGKTTGQTSWPSYSYTIKALWSDPFYAAMTATKTAGTDGTPTVDSSPLSSDYKGSNSGKVTFTLTAPAAKSGYYFSGWTGEGISFSSASALSTEATVSVSNTAGTSNAASYTATANYEKYSRIITINANGTPQTDGDQVIFLVEGTSQTYRVSVPVGGKVVLKDVASGSYTITPQGWSWNYNVSPTSDTTSWDDENKSTHTFTFTSKGSSTKHSEYIKTIKP